MQSILYGAFFNLIKGSCHSCNTLIIPIRERFVDPVSRSHELNDKE